jgi:AraC-like DNA-binding protein
VAAIRRLEDLQDAVHGAGLDAVQYSKGALHGSLAVTEHLGATFTVAHVGSHIAIRGPLSTDRITIGIGLRQPEGSRQWMREVRTGTVGIFLPGEEHQGIHAAGSSYVAVALSREGLEGLAAELDLILEPALFRSSGLHPVRLAEPRVAELARSFGPYGPGPGDAPPSVYDCRSTLEIAVTHLGRAPRGDLLRGPSSGRERIVTKALDYAMDRLDGPVSVEEMARAAHTSVRSLHRAFRSVLGESPASHLRRIRLHRIRKGLASPKEARCSVTRVAYRHGMTQLGRMARWYQEVFGESPSATLAGEDGALEGTRDGNREETPKMNLAETA